MPGLRSQAAADLAVTLTAPGDFGHPLTLTDPAGKAGALFGQVHDIGELVDPDLGTLVSGRRVTACVPTADMIAEAFTPPLPVGVVDDLAKPWLVGFEDLRGNALLFKVRETKPDEGLGFIALVLEFWRPAP